MTWTGVGEVSGLALRAVELTGMGVAAVSGALTAIRRRLDVFGVVIAALVTAVGGGTLRDVLLGRRPVWMQNSAGIVLIIAVALATVFYARKRQSELTWLLVADAFALAFFSIAGTRLALEQQTPAITAVLIGMVSGVAGGIVRDVLCNEVPLVFRGELYAVVALAGGLAYVSLARLGVAVVPATLAAVVFISAARIAAFTWRIRLPLLGFGAEEEA